MKLKTNSTRLFTLLVLFTLATSCLGMNLLSEKKFLGHSRLRVHHHQKAAVRLREDGLTGWPGREETFTSSEMASAGSTSQGAGCTTDDCRDWQEMLDVAECKMNLAAAQLDGQSVMYVMTEYKTTVDGEYGKLVYMLTDSSNEGSGGGFFVKVCIPVTRGQNAYLDMHCPLDPCGGYENDMQATCSSTLPEENAGQTDNTLEENQEAMNNDVASA